MDGVEEKKVKAKHVSTMTIVLAIVWTISMAIVKAFVPSFGLTVSEIVQVAFTLVGIIGAITGSIWLDKIKEIRNGK